MNASPIFRPNRRAFLGASLVGALGMAFSPRMQRLLAKEATTRRAKHCVLVWLNGGPSHIDTFDPKPGQSTGGPFKSILTKVSGLEISEHLPRLADQARNFSVIRSLTSKEADHDLAYQLMHTGNLRSETVDYPSLGSVVAREWKAEDGDLPAFVALNGGSPGAGFLGAEFAPYVVGDLGAPFANLALPEGVDERRLDRRLQALKVLNEGFATRVERRLVTEFQYFGSRARRLQRSPALKAFDLSTEKPELLKTYGIVNAPPAAAEGENAPPEDSPFGRACLVARKLVEHGVRFVEVTLDGWDTHADNFNQVAALSKQLDAGLSALLADLNDRGMLKETLVICMGEFGRTPTINAQNGRDHWSEAFSAIVSGGGMNSGQVIGATDAKGATVKERPTTPPDLFATLLAACGISGTTQYRTPEGRPIRLAEKGKVIKELLA